MGFIVHKILDLITSYVWIRKFKSESESQRSLTDMMLRGYYEI